MNRQIKFRGKRIDTGEWVEGYLVSTPTNVYIIPIGNELSFDLGAVEVDPSTVGQYTELKDKNRKEIYEGDMAKDLIAGCIYIFKFGTINHIVLSKNSGDLSKVNITGFYVEAIGHADGTFLWEDVKNDELEVIGNIHDNPELIPTPYKQEGGNK